MASRRRERREPKQGLILQRGNEFKAYGRDLAARMRDGSQFGTKLNETSADPTVCGGRDTVT